MLLSLSGVPDSGSRSGKPPLKPTQPSVVVKIASKWCIRQVGCDFSEAGALHGAAVRAGEVAMTLQVRALSEEEGHRLARMTRSQKTGRGAGPACADHPARD